MIERATPLRQRTELAIEVAPRRAPANDTRRSALHLHRTVEHDQRLLEKLRSSTQIFGAVACALRAQTDGDPREMHSISNRSRARGASIPRREPKRCRARRAMRTLVVVK